MKPDYLYNFHQEFLLSVFLYRIEVCNKLFYNYELSWGYYIPNRPIHTTHHQEVVMITMASASAKRICEVLDEESDLHNPDSPIYDVPDGSVDFENVSFKYSAKADRMALENINLHIPSGQTVGIIGGTGSSKTSLIQLISRLYDATEGRVLVGGHDVRDYDLESLRNQVAVVLQKNVLFSGTIKENLRWGDENATDEDLVRVCRPQCIPNQVAMMPKEVALINRFFPVFSFIVPVPFEIRFIYCESEISFHY